MKERLQRWRSALPKGQFWIYFSSAMLFNFGLSVFFFLFNVYLLGAGYHERALGVLGSCAAIGGLCGTVIAGILAERRGLRFTLLAGMSIAIAACSLRACVTTQSVQMVAAFVAGFGLSSLAVCLSPLVAALSTEADRPLAFSLIFASGIGDAGFGSLAAGWLPVWVEQHGHQVLTPLTAQRDVLLFGCAIAALGLFVLARLRLPTSVPGTRRRIARLSPFLLRFLPFIALWGIVTSALPPFANVYFVRHLGFSLQRTGSVLSFAQGVQLGAILLYPIVARRIGILPSILLTQVLTAVSLGVLACTTNASAAVCLYWGYTASQYANEPGLYSLLMEKVGAAERNGASASVFFIQAISQIIASSGMGFTITWFGYRPVLLGLAGLAGVATFLLANLKQSRGKEIIAV